MPEVGVFIADKGYDSNALRNIIEAQEAKSVIPRKRNSLSRCGIRIRQVEAKL